MLRNFDYAANQESEEEVAEDSDEQCMEETQERSMTGSAPVCVMTSAASDTMAAEERSPLMLIVRPVPSTNF